MNDFTFQNTTKVYFGKNQLSHLHEEVLKYGKTVLIAHGGQYIKNAPVYQNVINELKSNDIKVIELGAVDPNPRLATVNLGTKLCRENNVAVILAIGGGSTIDCCKAIAATTLSAIDNFWDLAEGKATWQEALPVIAMPTIASTGSEMDKSCVIANPDLNIKSGINGEAIRPKVAFLDPTNTFTVPAMQTACGGFDIMAHLLDMNYFVNADKYPLQFNVVETLLKTVREQLPIAINEPTNYQARATMLWAASWALNSFCTSGFKTMPTLHILEQFSAVFDMTHGLGLAIVAPKWMKYLLDHDQTVVADFARFATQVMNVPNNSDPFTLANQGIEAFQAFIKDELKLPVHLSEINMDESCIQPLLDKLPEAIHYAYRDLTKEDCENIFKMCL